MVVQFAIVDRLPITSVDTLPTNVTLPNDGLQSRICLFRLLSVDGRYVQLILTIYTSIILEINYIIRVFQSQFCFPRTHVVSFQLPSDANSVNIPILFSRRTQRDERNEELTKDLSA